MIENLIACYKEAVEKKKYFASLYQNPNLTKMEKLSIRTQYVKIHNDFCLPLSQMLENLKIDTYAIEKSIWEG